MPHGAPVSNETTVLSMHTMLGDASLDGVDVRLELRRGAGGGDVIRIDTADDLQISRGSAENPDAVATTESTVRCSTVDTSTTQLQTSRSMPCVDSSRCSRPSRLPASAILDPGIDQQTTLAAV